MTQQTNSTDPLLQPFTIKGLTFRNRIMSTSHSEGYSGKGMPKEALQRYHEEKARGGIGLTMFGGSSNVSPDSPDVFGQLNFGVDEVILYVEQFSRRVHQHGAAIMVQITHLGRRGSATIEDWLPTIAPSAVRETVHRSIPKEMDVYDIQRVIREYGDAAWRCQEGGLDGLETMTGGHLTGQFLSPMTNRRTDKYGGSLENRLRFIREVHAEIRQRVGDGFLTGIRYVIDEKTAGWLNADEALRAAQILEADGTIDFFNLNIGRIDTQRKLSEDCMPGIEQPLAPFLEDVGQFKAEVNLPVFHASRIIHIETARQAIRDGVLDMVAMTRAHIADPHLVNKLMRGEEQRVRPCVGTQFCQSTKPVFCIHNPSISREAKFPHIVTPAEHARKIVIIGGGVAGMEAARVCAERGHQVVLFEASHKLGGQINLASKVASRQGLQGIVAWRESELVHLDVTVRLDKRASIDDISAETPDVVIIATGGTPYISGFKGAELCHSVWDGLNRPSDFAGNDVLIYDGIGQHQAPSCAVHLSQAGASVNFVTLDAQLAEEMGGSERVMHRKRFQQFGIPVHIDLHIERVERKGGKLEITFIHELTDTEHRFTASRIIIEQGTQPTADLYHALRDAACNKGVTHIKSLIAAEPQPERGVWETGYELHRIGNAVSSRSIHAAVFDALRLCMLL
ncbi:MAG: 2,4-dienoyl-CoA reductase-like NADH-dependent reductase (Old Yellow Enzyme family) [Cellvibrionaceae bacterium]